MIYGKFCRPLRAYENLGRASPFVVFNGRKNDLKIQIIGIELKDRETDEVVLEILEKGDLDIDGESFKYEEREVKE